MTHPAVRRHRSGREGQGAGTGPNGRPREGKCQWKGLSNHYYEPRDLGHPWEQQGPTPPPDLETIFSAILTTIVT